MAYVQKKLITVDGSDEVRIGLSIQGQPYDAVFHKKRFERVMDKVDVLVHRGYDAESIQNKFAEYIISLEPRVVDRSPRKQMVPKPDQPFDKVAHVKQYIEDNPTCEIGMIAKSAASTSDGRMTYQNAYYIAKKLRGKEHS